MSKSEMPAPRMSAERPVEGALAVGLMEAFRFLRRRFWVIAVSGFVVLAVVVAIVQQLTPLYTSRATVFIDTRENRIADVQAVYSGLTSEAVDLEGQAEIIRSAAVAERVIDELGLMNDPEFNSALRPDEQSILAVVGLDDVFRFVVSQVRASPAPTAGDEDPRAEADRDRRERERVIGSFLGGLAVRRDDIAPVVTISFTSEDREKAARIANAVADQYIVDQLEARFEATRRATDWLNERLAELSWDLRQAEETAEAFRKEQGLIDTGELTLVEQRLADTNAQLMVARADLAERQARLQQARQLGDDSQAAETFGDVMGSPLVVQLRRQEAELMGLLADLSQSYGSNHPEVRHASAQLRDVRAYIGEEIGRILGSLESNVSVAEARVQTLEDSLQDLEANTAVNNVAAIQLRELERRVEVGHELHRTYLARFEEMSEQEGIEQPEARLLSQAMVPGSPSYPNTKLLLAAGILLAGTVGVGLALVLEMVQRGYQTVQRLEDDLGLSNLAMLPTIRRRPGTGRTAGGPADPALRGAYAEALRMVRTALTVSNIDDPPKIVLVASALPGEGKTRLAVDLGRLCAQAGQRVLLFDGDFRRPSVRRALGLPPSSGLVELLVGDTGVGDVVQTDPRSGLHVLAGSRPLPNVFELLSSERLRALFAELRRTYDMVIVDSPPLLGVADGRILAKTADQTLLTVRWNKTPRAAARRAVKLLEDVGATIAGTVFSQVDLRRNATFGEGEAGYYLPHLRRYYVQGS